MNAKVYVAGSRLKTIMLCLLLCFVVNGFAQNNFITVSGKVTSDSSALDNVTVQLKGDSRRAAQTDSAGRFSIKAPANGTLVFSRVGFENQEVEIQGNSTLNVRLRYADSRLGDVVVVGFGTQRRSTLVSSVTSIEPKDIKGPTSNLTTMLAGRISGLISYQTTGEPGKDNASFFIRGLGTFGSGKRDPLILIDGIESSTTDLARLQPDNIAGFSILKDATATAVYGARGANGVVLVTTKVGQAGKIKLNLRLENSVSANTQNIGLANNIDYMTLANEAVLTRNPKGATLYTQNKIDHTAAGDDPLLYPNNDWIKLMIKDATLNQRANLNISGGGDKSKYYLAFSYNLDNGNLRQNSLNGFNTNIKLKSYSVLSNISLSLTKTTEALVSLKGQFDDYSGPIPGTDERGNQLSGGATVYNNALYSNPVAFPAIYPASYLPYAKHPLFGNAIIPGSANQLYTNPYAKALSGFQTNNASTLIAQISLRQNFDFITPGLSARMMTYATRYANFSVSRQVSPYYYSPILFNGAVTGLNSINDGSQGNPFPAPTEYLSFLPGDKTVNSIFYTEAAVNYNRVFNQKHSVSGMLIGILRSSLSGNATDLQGSLPARNQGVSGRFTYGFDNRYLVEFDFGYNGSERFAANHRYGFFPSAGFGWAVSNEKFFRSLLPVVSNFKLRGTFGLVGNDQIGNAGDRFFYLSNVGLNGPLAGGFGTNFNNSRNTVFTSRYANPDITWEESQQLNIGLDLTILKDIKITVDAYRQLRTNILMSRSTIPVTMGLQATPAANVGRASSKGIDIALDYQKSISKYFWASVRGTMTYATSKLLVNEEPKYDASNANLSRVGNSLSQIYGLVAERLFIDDKEVNNSPTQFGNVLAGDIKYRDINGDGKISIADFVPVGLPTVPELQFGGGFSIGYRNFDLSVFFQGNSRVSFLIDPIAIAPFYNQHGLLNVIAQNHWSEDQRNSYAFWPRLNINSDAVGGAPTYNNNYTSTWWLRNGAFMRLKSAELGYNLGNTTLKRLKLASARVYVNGINLLTLSAFKLWDPEMGGSGLGYPIQRAFNAGILLGL